MCSAHESFFGEFVLGKARVLRGTPLPPPSESPDWRGVCKNAPQNLEPQGFRGQNLENKKVRACFAISACTASALAMICSLSSRVKVGCHIWLRKTLDRISCDSHPFAKSARGLATRIHTNVKGRAIRAFLSRHAFLQGCILRSTEAPRS